MEVSRWGLGGLFISNGVAERKQSCAVMRCRKMFLAMALLAGLLAAAQEPAAVPDWEEWQETTILIGNERDGFNDSVEARRIFSNPKAYDGLFYLPYLAKAPDEERILLLVETGTPKRTGKLLESTDEGETWHDPVPKGNRGISGWGLTAVGNGLLFATDGLYRSDDNGATWQDLGGFPVNPRFGTPLAGWHPLVAEPGTNGKHLYKTLYFSRNFDNMEFRMEPLISESHDAGLTWDTPRGVPEWSGANEACLAYNAKGELVAALRVETISAPVNDEYDQLEVSCSADGGRTWTMPKVVAGIGRHHPSMALLPDGRMVMSYVVRLGYPKENGKYAYGIEAVLSNDGGHTWDTDHRYLLAHWTHDCIVTDEYGRTVQTDTWHAAPTNTSTIYLPKSGCLLTAYGTKQNIARRVGGYSLPWQVGMVKWKPLDTYSGVKSEPKKPIPAEEALRQIRSCAAWRINYVASVGVPDAGWRNTYAGNAVRLKGDWLELDHRGCHGYLSARGTDALEEINGPVGLRMRLNIPKADDPKPDRFQLYAVVGTGQNKYILHLRFDKDANLKGETFGEMELPTTPGTPFLVEAYCDPRSHCTRLWIDGQLVKETIAPPHYVAPEKPAVFCFGSESLGIGSVVELAELKFGPVGE